MITLQNITDGIVKSLFDEFGAECAYYTEDIPQNLDAPAFLVQCVTPKAEQFLGRRYKRSNLFNINYFPKSEDFNAEINGVWDRVFSALEYITVDGDLTRGTNISSVVSDGVLVVTVSYDMFVYETADNVKMEELICRASAKKGGRG